MAAFIRLRVSHQQFILLLTLLLSLAQPLRVSAATAPLTTCICGAADRSAQALLAPQPGGSPGPIQLAQNTSLCLTTAKSAGGITCDGTCLFFDSCGPTSANFSVLTSGDHLVLQDANNASLCVDFNEAVGYTQFYACLGDPNQKWLFAPVPAAESVLWPEIGGKSPIFIKEDYDAIQACLTLREANCQRPFCPKYHQITSPGLYDPSGPLQTPDGVYHMWEDMGDWTHYTSTDLVHWHLASPSSNFSGLTGSVSPTPEGVFAFWPAGDQSGIITAVATDSPSLNRWQQRPGLTIEAPAYTGTNFRDPARAFLHSDGSWYVGVGCNNRSQSADVCLFRAADPTLANFTDAGPLFSVTSTMGQRDNNGVWTPTPAPANMMECPDVFPLGPKPETFMVIGSLFSTNQWWTGTVAGSPPRFTPAAGGLVDFGDYYAAKSGSAMVQNGTTRRLLYGFSGWSEPTAEPGCGRALLLPRDITLSQKDGITPFFDPVPELHVLRNGSSHVHLDAGASLGAGAFPKGPQLELHIDCDLTAAPTLPGTGVVAFRTLTTSNSTYTEVGYDFAKGAMYADQSRCCGPNPSGIVQTAPLPPDRLLGLTNGALNLTYYVDGGLIEGFGGHQVVLTTLVAPNGLQEGQSTTAFINTADLKACTVQAWALNPIAPAPPPLQEV